MYPTVSAQKVHGTEIRVVTEVRSPCSLCPAPQTWGPPRASHVTSQGALAALTRGCTFSSYGIIDTFLFFLFCFVLLETSEVEEIRALTPYFNLPVDVR